MRIKTKTIVYFPVLVCAFLYLTGCLKPNATPTSASTSTTPAGSSGGGAGSSPTSGAAGFQIITRASSTGSFDAATPPVSGGLSIRAARIYNLDGSLLTTSSGTYPTWFSQANVFLTSTRTSGGSPAYTGSDTPCAYFDSYTDNNPDSSGHYVIDGYALPTGVTSDIDQCAGVVATEATQLGLYVRLDRRFMSVTDKLQVIINARPIEEPVTAPSASACVTGGAFDAAACTNQYYTVTMRSAPGATAQPFYILFPSAKSLDLLSESVLLPIQIDTSLTTITIDRVKGGSIFYGITVIRIP